jgi:uncharacterized protein (DUF302 family)
VPVPGLVTLDSAFGVAATLQRLESALAAKSITVFARVDHAAGAATVGQALRPTTMVMFGNPAAGTPVMQAAQTAGIDLPLKMLVWQDGDGTAKLSYNDPAWIAARHGIGAHPAIAALAGALAALARQATSGD